MKLEINKKIFIGRYNEVGKLIIPLFDDDDKHFFKNWSKIGGSKKDYIKNIDFEKITERGILKNCFPILDMNEEFVELVYDFFEVKI